MTLSISWPLTIITTLLITLYWLELLTQSRVRVPGFLSSLKWPFFGTSLVVVGVELATSISRALSVGPISTLTTVSGVMYAVILGASTLLFFIVGSRTLKQLHEGKKISSSSASAKRILSKARISSIPLRVNIKMLTPFLPGHPPDNEIDHGKRRFQNFMDNWCHLHSHKGSLLGLSGVLRHVVHRLLGPSRH